MSSTNITDDTIGALNTGIEQAVAEGSTPERQAEIKFVQKLADRVQNARKWDENAHRQYAIDRAYVRGDSGFDVDGNMVGTFIDILKSFIYARNPDVDILPALSAEPPSVDALRDAAELAADAGSPELAQAIAVEIEKLVLQGVPPIMAQQQAPAMVREQVVSDQFKALQNRYQKRQRDNRAFAETLEMVVAKLWNDAKLKSRGQQATGSALSIGIGWLKVSWQERTQDDPAIRRQINDLQGNISRINAAHEEMDEGEISAGDAEVEQYRLQVEQLEAGVKKVVARGLVIDFVPAEYITVAPGVDLQNAEDAPWIDEMIPMRVDEAKALFGLTTEQANKATKFSEAKPVMRRNVSPMAGAASSETDTITAKDANRFTSGDQSGNDGSASGDWVMAHETWDIEQGKFFTWVEGVEGYVLPPAEPTPSQRFFPYFAYTIGNVDGQRHPQSLVSRANKLIDEYYRIKSAERDHRKRVKPKTVFIEGHVDSGSVDKVTKGVTAEFVGIKTLNPKADARGIFLPLSYPALDPALYDTSRVMADIERIFGVQEALSGAINTPKTATEAQIQQTGMQSRTGAMRDALEDVLTAIAFYTAEIARANMDIGDVQAIVGPDAMWPDYRMGEDVGTMLNVTIRAGSTGKPNTTAERQSWAALLPILQAGVMQIGQMRGASPADMADAMEEIIAITLKRNDERIALDTLLPAAGPAQAPMPGAMPALPSPAAPAGLPPVDPTASIPA